MFFYALEGYEDQIILTNEKEFTPKQFDEMCKEVPIAGIDLLKWYDTNGIIEHLIGKYGFRYPDVIVSFFIDADIEDKVGG